MPRNLPTYELPQRFAGRGAQALLWRALFACCILLGTQGGTALAQPALAPVLNTGTRTVISGQYIVVFKRGDSVQGQSANITPDAASRAAMMKASKSAQSAVRRAGGTVTHVYSAALVGFSAKLPPAALKAMQAYPGVAFIEADQKVSGTVVQINPPTGLDRTSERLALDNRYTYNPAETGALVDAYVIDSGVNMTSVDYVSRLGVGVDEIGDGNGTNDCFGHGAHVAGTIGGTTYGIAKAVTLYPVRVLDCTNSGSEAGVTAGVDWVTNRVAANPGRPAVANMSLGAAVPLLVLNPAVAASIASGITYTIAAGNNGIDACGFSPAMVPTAITVGAIDPTNDTRPGFSDFGPCVDLFAPGVNILSDGIGSPAATLNDSGTSMAAPHVAGVAVHVLQLNPTWSPAQVLAKIHQVADVLPNPYGWLGLSNPGAGSPNELLHWGSLNDGYDDGEPHLTTVDGTYYDFQPAGEFTYLRDADGLEIQTRQTPIATPADPPHACVSLNSAVAARVGSHRVTYEPNVSGAPDPSGMQLRVDGILKTLDANGINFGGGGRVKQSTAATGAIQIDFPDGTTLVMVPWWWTGAGGKWLMNVDVYHTPASSGIMGAKGANSWLPALPNGSSLGQMPGTSHDTYVMLNQTFADAWRVTNANSLFDYKPGTSTSTFTVPGWPVESGHCVLPRMPVAQPVSIDIARKLCQGVNDKRSNESCIYDVAATGAQEFAKAYLATERVRRGGTMTTVTDNAGVKPRMVAFTASVALMSANGTGTPAGTVQFTVDGKPVGERIRLKDGQAVYTTDQAILRHKVRANFIPEEGSVYLPSSGLDETHMVFGQ